MNFSVNHKLSSLFKSIKSVKRFRGFFINVLIAALIALLINLFILGTTKITSESMENTILKGDFLFVEKLSYGTKFPPDIAILQDVLPEFRFPGLFSTERGDILLFENPLTGTELSRFNKKQNFVKRCIGLPGDSVSIKNRIVIVNNQTLTTEGEIKYDRIPVDYRSLHAPDKSGWTIDNYGPVYIPRKGDIIPLTINNIKLYEEVINIENTKDSISVVGEKIFLGDRNIDEYQFKKNYYFLLGDNRNRSSDSRFWGFLSEDKIIGRVFMCYMSIVEPRTSEDNFFFQRIRWNRIAKLIK